MASSTAAKNRRVPHPLQTLRFIAGLTREACANVADLTAASVQNIELGKAPLYLENAELLEAYTDCHSLHLLEQIQKWRDGKLKKRADLITLKGEPFTEESFAAYKAVPVTEEDVEEAIRDIRTRMHLLLGGLSDRSHEFRAAYRRIAQFTLRERKRSGVTEAELMQRAQSGAMVETRHTTVKEMADDPDINSSSTFQNQIAGHYPPETPVVMSIETFRSWCFVSSTAEAFTLLNPNQQTGTTTLRRMNFPDGKQHVIRTESLRVSPLTSGVTAMSNEFWDDLSGKDGLGPEQLEAWQARRRSLSREKSTAGQAKRRKPSTP